MACILDLDELKMFKFLENDKLYVVGTIIQFWIVLKMLWCQRKYCRLKLLLMMNIKLKKRHFGCNGWHNSPPIKILGLHITMYQSHGFFLCWMIVMSRLTCKQHSSWSMWCVIHLIYLQVFIAQPNPKRHYILQLKHGITSMKKYVTNKHGLELLKYMAHISVPKGYGKWKPKHRAIVAPLAIIIFLEMWSLTKNLTLFKSNSFKIFC